MDGVQPFHQTFRVVFALIQSNEANHTPQDAGAERIRVALPATRQHGQSFFIEICAVGLVFLESCADADDLPRCAVVVQTQLQACTLGGVQERDGFCIFADQSGAKFCASGQRGGNACLFGKQDGFFFLGQPGVHLADDGEVCAAVHGTAGHDGVLTVKDVVVAVPVADLGRIGNQFGELCRHLLNIGDVQLALVLGRDFQISTVDDLFLIRSLRKQGFNDGFGGGTSRDKILSIMKDSHIGTYGVLGLLFYYGLMWNILTTLSVPLACAAILSGDAWSKFCAAQIINTLPYARKEEESKAKVIYDRMSPGVLLSAFMAGALPMLLLLDKGYWWAAIAPAMMFILLMSLMRRRLQGYTGDCCGATFLLCEFSFYLTINLIYTNLW